MQSLKRQRVARVFTFFLLRCKCVIIAWSRSRSCKHHTKHHPDLFTIKNTLDSVPRHGFIFQAAALMAIIHHPSGDGKQFRAKFPTHLLKLELQLGDDLHLDAGLGGALVVQHVLHYHVLLKLGPIVTAGIASSPLTQTWQIAHIIIVTSLHLSHSPLL